MYFKYQNKILDDLKELKKIGLFGIKSEFEAEASSLRDITNLRILTFLSQTKLYVKIGGAEAINDIKNCLEIGVDGIIAPMIESEFALYKFINYFEKNNFKNKPKIIINIESVTGFKNLKRILILGAAHIDSITIGRTDLSKSFFKSNKKPNDKELMNDCIKISKIAKNFDIKCTLGGSVDKKTIDLFKNNKKLINIFEKIETRKVIFKSKDFLKKNALDFSLKFEQNYILFKNELRDFYLKDENNRLTILKTRK